MKIIFFSLLLLFLFNASAQEKPKNNYLIIRIKIEKDLNMSRYGCSIIAEGGCDSAKSIYNLKDYNFKKNANNDDHSFYYNYIDNSTSKYNFFNTPTEALNFMAKMDGHSPLSILKPLQYMKGRRVQTLYYTL